MRLWTGLGNPGAKYAMNRHNIGFMALDRIAEDHGFSPWKARFQGLVAEGRLGGEKLLLLKPQTFMNLSGTAVAKLARTHEVPVEGIIVVHDDLDIPEATVRVKRGGGHGGHNGLRSLVSALGGGDFLRVRVGIGRPPGRQDPADFVLEPLRREVAERLADVVPHAAQAALHVLEHGVESAMREYNAD